MRVILLLAFAFLVNFPLSAGETAIVRAADGFQLPVGPNGTGQGYYIARGYRPNGHLGEDWNGVGGGDTDLGDPVYAAANGIVVFARNYHVGWGNVVILRHAYYEGSDLRYVDSLYGHLLEFSVQEGEQVRRGQQIARIGNNFGMYEAHLHFEMRKNLQIGMYRSSFARDFSNYYTPNEFIAAHRMCPRGNHMVSAPINTFPAVPPPILAGPHVPTPVFGPPPAGAAARFAKVSPLPPAPAISLPNVPSSAKTARAASPAPSSGAPGKTSRSASDPALASASPPPSASRHSGKLAAATTPAPASKPAAAAKTAPSSQGPKVAEEPDSSEPTVVLISAPSAAAKTGKGALAGKRSIRAHVPSENASGPASAADGTVEHPKVFTPTVVTSMASTKPAVLFRDSKPVAAASDVPLPPKKADSLDLIPEQIAAGPTPLPSRKNRKVSTTSSASRPAPSSRLATQSLPPEPILPTPGSDAAPIRPVGGTYKVDRFEDLRGRTGY